MGSSVCLLLALLILFQYRLDQVQNRTLAQIQTLANLPKGDYIKPVLLGYHHVGADLLWLRLLQVVGNKQNSAVEYEWMYHAVDVITTLDPQYAYAYYAGGVILGDLAHRTDLSNRLLSKGTEANPTVWNLPFLLGYNYYFLLDDPDKGAEYIMRASSLPDRPAYLPGLATRLSAESGKPETALAFLEARLRETQDPQMREEFMRRMKEILIERDIRLLEQAVEVYRTKHQALPSTLTALVADRVLPGLPQEPFGGVYRLDGKTGAISSSTHPDRLRTFFKRTQPPVYLPKITPAYSFPRTWE
jgi:tetratricopeptide (TPR) repeat protein